VSTAQGTRKHGKGAWRNRLGRRHLRTHDEPGDVVTGHDEPGDVAMSRDDRLIWLSIAVVAGVDGGLVAGLLTAVAGGTRQVALAAGGVAALGTFGTVLTVVRFLHNPSEK
jgi:hypothetical protein